MNKNTHKYKSLTTQINKAQSELKEFEKEQKRLKDKIASTNQKVRNLTKEREKLKTKDIIVTEHAILRYIERVYGINLDEIRDKILTDETRLLIEKLGNGNYPIGDNASAVVKDRIVITVK